VGILNVAPSRPDGPGVITLVFPYVFNYRPAMSLTLDKIPEQPIYRIVYLALLYSWRQDKERGPHNLTVTSRVDYPDALSLTCWYLRFLTAPILYIAGYGPH